MRIIIVRHGQTEENVGNGLANRQSDVLLNDQGILQAKKLAEHLKGEKITHAYVSPLTRAVDTAKHILAHHSQAQLFHADQLLEQNLGVADSLPKAVWKEMKKNALQPSSGQAAVPFHIFKAEGGESYKELQERATKFFHELIQKHPNDTVLVVSHGGTLGVLLLHLLEKELTEENYRAHQPKNTEFTVVEIGEDGQKKVHVLNSGEHLA